MKNITPTQKAWLAALAGTVFRADLFKIDLTQSVPGYGYLRGAILYATNGQADVTYGGQTYRSEQYGAWDRGTQKSVADFSLESNSMTLTLTADTTVAAPFPNASLSLLELVNLGLFDGASVDVETVYMSSWGNIQVAMTLFSGMISSAQRVGRSKAEFEVRDWNYLLNLKVPLRVIQPGCWHTLFDHGCGLGAASFSFTTSAGAGSTPSSIIMSPSPGSTGWGIGHPNDPGAFVGGYILWTAGPNSGLRGHIVSENMTTWALGLAAPTSFPVTVGDSFTVYAGCDKSAGTCKNKFNNIAHFGGMPFTPPPEQAI